MRARSLAIVLAIIAVLALQLLQPSVFNPAVRAKISEGLGAPAPVADRPSIFLFGNLALHIAIAWAALASSRARQRLPRYRAFVLAVLAYGAVVVVATSLATPSVGTARVVQASAIPLTILSLAVCLPVLLDSDEYDALFRGIVGLLAITSIVSLGLVISRSAELFGVTLLRSDQRGGALAAVGVFVHRNTIGSFLEFGPALAVYLMARAAAGRRAIYAACFIVITSHLLLTFSRSSQVVAAISLLPLLSPARSRLRIVIVVAALAAASAAAVVLLVPEFRAYAALGASLTRRQDIWRAMLHQSLERPWLGFGLQNVTYLGHGVRYGPHNLLVAQLVYFGVLGLVAFVAVLAQAARLVLERLRDDSEWPSRVIVLLVAGVLLQGVVEYILTAPVFFANSVFWILVGFSARPRAAGAYSTP